MTTGQIWYLSIAQLVERWTVELSAIHRSLVRFRFERFFFHCFFCSQSCHIILMTLFVPLLHQHFDSDDEGRGGIRNPIISTILYITSADATVNEMQTGGPSLVTNQKLTDIRLATKGYLAHPKPQRLVAFDGRYLHGVVPGKGYRGGRRVTLMMAFWEDIQVRDGDGPGSARPFPSNDNLPEWASVLVAPLDGGNDTSDYKSCIERDPIKLDVIYESLDGKPWKRGMGMPSYDQVFQGF